MSATSTLGSTLAHTGHNILSFLFQNQVNESTVIPEKTNQYEVLLSYSCLYSKQTDPAVKPSHMRIHASRLLD